VSNTIEQPPYAALIEACLETHLLVAHVPAIPGAHTQAHNAVTLIRNLREVVEMVRPGMLEQNPSYLPPNRNRR